MIRNPIFMYYTSLKRYVEISFSQNLSHFHWKVADWAQKGISQSINWGNQTKLNESSNLRVVIQGRNEWSWGLCWMISCDMLKGMRGGGRFLHFSVTDLFWSWSYKSCSCDAGVSHSSVVDSVLKCFSCSQHCCSVFSAKLSQQTPIRTIWFPTNITITILTMPSTTPAQSTPPGRRGSLMKTST